MANHTLGDQMRHVINKSHEYQVRGAAEAQGTDWILNDLRAQLEAMLPELDRHLDLKMSGGVCQ